ncbi:hypothetical protein GLYMA_07G246650v4 [Glycine max]|nr:hypothetical protein GLYMA_07G246650v4 [Glycine max]KAH1088452.1 hypothetical protein GYH30_019479 [Glycine max]
MCWMLRDPCFYFFLTLSCHVLPRQTNGKHENYQFHT